MNVIERHNIQVGDKYKRADGSAGIIEVIDVTTNFQCDDVGVCDIVDGTVLHSSKRFIDAFKLHCVRYCKL